MSELDPRIALEGNNQFFDYAKTMQNAAQAGNSMVEASQRARAFAAQKWYGDNADQWTKTDPATGQTSIDYAQLMKQANLNGFSDLAPEIGQGFNNSVQSQLGNATSAQEIAKKKIDNAVQAGGILAQQLKAAQIRGDDAEITRLMQAAPGHIDSLIGSGTSDSLGIPKVDPNGPPDSEAPLDWAHSFAPATMTEQEHQQMGIAQGNLGIAQKQQWATANEAASAAIGYQNKAQLYKNAVSKLGSYNLPWTSTSLGEVLGLSNQAVNQMLTDYNNSNPGANLTLASGKDRLMQAFQQEQAKQNALAGNANQAAQTLSRGSGNKPVKMPDQPTGKINTTAGTAPVTMVDPMGKIHKVDPQDVSSMLDRGWKR